MNSRLLLLLTLLFSAPSMAFVPVEAVRSTDIKTICSVKTSTIRHVSYATRMKVYKLAGIPYKDRKLCYLGYEVDHRLPLGLGGNNDISNLQLQAYCTRKQLAPYFPTKVLYDAKAKDKIETEARREICAPGFPPEKLAEVQNRVYGWRNK